MKCIIFGAGALGQALGCMLAADGHQIDLVIRRRFIEPIESSGLRVTGIFGDYLAAPGKLHLLEDVDPARGPRYDVAFITTKSYDTGTAIAALTTLHGFDKPVVSVQNGCGNVEQVMEAFGSERACGARVITGFEIEKPGLVRITVSADDVHIGSSVTGTLPVFVRDLSKVINKAGLPCKAVEDIYQDLFAKLLYNCALNPLGAVLGVHYGALGDSTHTRSIMDRVIDEAFAVIHGLDGTTPWENADRYREIFYGQLLPATYNHRPSMLQDLENGKQTEVEGLAGYVTRQGQRLGIATPVCAMLAGLVRFKEEQARQKKSKAD